MSTLKPVLVAAALLVFAGCSAGEADEGELISSQVEELATTGRTYEKGTALRTTANLNLRANGSLSARILRVMPNGSRVTVREKSGGNAWVAVDFNGHAGWAHTDYLVKVSSGGGGGAAASDDAPRGYGAARGAKLASTALRVDGRAASGWCSLETSNSVERSGVLPGGVTWYRNHAADLAEYMASNPGYTAKVGFRRVDVSPNDIPKGSVVGWRRGQCGYSSKYGHIEISVDDSSTRACSDFCGRMPKTCGRPYVFMTTTL